jgi:hypothetical protein
VIAAAQQQEPCPWCGQHISRAKFLQIEARIRDEQKRQLQQAEAEMRAKLAAEREVLETKAKAERATHELLLQSLRESLDKANDEKEQFDRKLKEAATSAATAERKKIEADLAQKHQAELNRERELLKTQLVKQKADNQDATKALQKQIADLQKRLAEQANEKPEVVNIDIVEALKGEFKDDRVIRLPKTEKNDSGGDVLVEIKYKNAVCAKILLDTHMRGNWQTSYATKLHAEAAAQTADYAVVATVHFPKGASELHRHDDVLLVHPARVVEVVGILRNALVRMFKNKLSSEQRAEKKALLYDHITSDAFRRKLTDVNKVTEEIAVIDAEEQDTHARVWRKRGSAMQKLQKLHKQVADEIDDIVDGIEADDRRGN